MEEAHRYQVVCSGRSIIIVCRDCKEQWHLKFRWLLLLNFIGFLLPLAAVILYFQLIDPPYKLIIPVILGIIFFFIGQLVPPPIFCYFLRKSNDIEKFLNQTN